jgi:acetyl esterase/lipase
MVMGRRPEVKTASAPAAAFAVEILIDRLCRVALPPFLRGLGVTLQDTDLGGVPALECRPSGGGSEGVLLYLHGGGFIGTSPSMYSAFTGRIAHETGCRVVVPDYRLAPEFPFPAGLDDAVSVYQAILAAGLPVERLFVAGDSGGGNLATALLIEAPIRHLPKPAGLILFSPEISLSLDEGSITSNEDCDILPWNIPVRPYLQEFGPRDERVLVEDADLRRFPPTLVAFGDDEMFRDAIRQFVERLERSGVDTTSIEEPRMFHVFPILMPWADASARVYRAVAAFVRKRFEQAAREGAAGGLLSGA